jgi:hypothetical protein
MSTEQGLNEIAEAQLALGTAGTALVQAGQALDRAVQELTEPTPEPDPEPDPLPEPPDPDPDPEPEPSAGRWMTFTPPPEVEVPRLTAGTRPTVPIPGTGLAIRFTADLVAKTNGASMQCEYEHSDSAPRPTDPLVTPGDGNPHLHDFWGSTLGDVEDLEHLADRLPQWSSDSPMADRGPRTWAVDPELRRVGHQPGLWHPAVYARLDGGWKRCRIGKGSALNYVRVTRSGGRDIHSLDDRLIIPPNGVGWISPITRVNYSEGRRYRISWDGPTWATQNMWVGPWDSPTHRAAGFAFGHQPNPWGDGGVPLAQVQVYFKSPDLVIPQTPRPDFAYGMMPGTAMPGMEHTEGHIDYVAGSTPLAVGNGRILGIAGPDEPLETILLGQWIADMTLNQHLFHGGSPLYGRWELAAA